VKETSNDLTSLNPVKSYTPPELPSLKDARKDPSFLKKLPSRWKNNAKVVTCIGLIGAGMLTLTACPVEDVLDGRTHHGGAASMPIYVDGKTEHDNKDYIPTQVITEDLAIMAHYGGSGGGPYYVVYLTEQEALSIILSQLEAAGLRFTADVPGYTADVHVDVGFGMQELQSFGLDYYDDLKDVAIIFAKNEWLADRILRRFNEQDINTLIGVFFTPELNPDTELGLSWDWNYEREELIREEPDNQEIAEEIADVKERARPLLEARLNSQIYNFIDVLLNAGVIDSKTVGR